MGSTPTFVTRVLHSQWAFLELGSTDARVGRDLARPREPRRIEKRREEKEEVRPVARSQLLPSSSRGGKAREVFC